MDTVREIKPLLKEDEWRVIRILHEKPEDIPAVRYGSLQMGMEEKKLRDGHLSRLVKNGYLAPRTYQFTELGERTYQDIKAWWGALVWKLQETGLDLEQAAPLADKLVCMESAGPLIQRTLEQEAYARMQQDRQAESELIGDTDLVGVLKPGTYQVDYCFLDEEDRFNAGFAAVSEVTERFAPGGMVVVEPMQSRLELTWRDGERRLLGIRYRLDGRDHFEPAEAGVVKVYFRAMRFEQVARYRILDGECRVTVCFQQMDPQGHWTEIQKELRLELPLSYEWREEHHG